MYSGHRERHAAGLIQHVAAAFPDVYGRVMLGMSAQGAGEAVGIGELVGVLTEANSWKQAGFYSDLIRTRESGRPLAASRTRSSGRSAR